MNARSPFFTRGQEITASRTNLNTIKEVRPLKDILMIATGGTIASKPTPQGLAPMLSAGEILACVPGLSDICQV